MVRLHRATYPAYLLRPKSNPAMKKLLWPLALISLAATTVLAFALVRGIQAPSVETSGTTSRPSPANKATGSTKIDETIWPSLQSAQLPDLVSRLRAAGFPIAVIRAMIRAEIARLYAERMKALDPEADNRPFWKRGVTDPKVQLAMRQLGREQQKLMRDLLGRDAEATDPMSQYYADRRFGTLSPEKRDQARDIIREFDEKRSDIYMSFTGGGMLPADREKINALEKQQRETLAKVLSPAELEEYDFRSSNTGNSLRYELAAFDATEQEFRTIYQLKKVMEDQFGPFMGNT